MTIPTYVHGAIMGLLVGGTITACLDAHWSIALLNGAIAGFLFIDGLRQIVALVGSDQ